MVTAPPIFERSREPHLSPRSLRTPRQRKPDSYSKPAIRIPSTRFAVANSLVDSDSFAVADTTDEGIRPATSIGMAWRESIKGSHSHGKQARPSTSDRCNSGANDFGELARTDEHEWQIVIRQLHDKDESVITSHREGKPIEGTAEDVEIPLLNVSMVRSEDRDAYELPIESDRWYRRPGWRSQRVAHFRTPLDTDNFLPGTRRATAERGVAEWRWDADAAGRKWQWRRVCRLRPAAEIFSVAHLRAMRRDDAAWEHHPLPLPRSLQADSGAPSPQNGFGSQHGCALHTAKAAVGEERRRRVEEAISLLLSGPVEARPPGGGWRAHVRVARTQHRPR
jgi:hypothetical protein